MLGHDRWRIEGKAELVMENSPSWTAITDLGQFSEHQAVEAVWEGDLATQRDVDSS